MRLGGFKKEIVSEVSEAIVMIALKIKIAIANRLYKNDMSILWVRKN